MLRKKIDHHVCKSFNDLLEFLMLDHHLVHQVLHLGVRFEQLFAGDMSELFCIVIRSVTPPEAYISS